VGHRYGELVRLVRYTHSCVRLEADGRILVIDPGVWSEPQALHGADAVLVTHLHSDHVDRLRLAGLGIPVYAPEAIPGVATTVVGVGEAFAPGGFDVRAVGGRHAPVAGGEPALPNLGYLVGGLYHPGDALHVPDERVDTLLVPMQASWLKLAEALDFVRATGPRRAYGIHDAQVNERGRDGPNHWLGRTSAGYRWLAPGEADDLTGTG
jgi:L-ascorbate metabolism protein UlaG (beta-lactamase superfamily)